MESCKTFSGEINLNYCFLLGQHDQKSKKDKENLPESVVESLKMINKPIDKTKFAALEADVQRSEEEWSKVRNDISDSQRIQVKFILIEHFNDSDGVTKPEMCLQLEAENKQLYQEFNEMIDEIK